ncbi:putative transcriptional regulator [Fontibacillus solani]|uniref:Putative transcriptional regulator n=1 Tax=Fontibacillus solani TaxID=1572857 RepID=A0A7W3SX09_9BACL|nr:helix-turn-helix transcriptional regulator [Fontibacillus solani]MBA9087674.1 putative transcriptional regulator [Fontibacillus solani]
MIKIKVSELLGKHKMTRKELSELTGIRAGTVGMLYDETIKRIDVEWLNKICKVFDCPITDVIEYVPDQQLN